VQGIGASLSGLAAGVIVDHFGYSAAFLAAGAAALAALVVFAIWMPETAEAEPGPRDSKTATEPPRPADLAPA
jgi:predicted MFS family arabinose efflux permease